MAKTNIKATASSPLVAAPGWTQTRSIRDTLLLLLVLILTSLGSALAGDYPYNFYECTGPNRYIVIDGKEHELKDFDPASDSIAVGSFQHLPASILYPNSISKIILTGDYDPATQLFTLKHWTLPVPYIEWQKMERLEGCIKVTRYSLTRKDFERSAPRPKPFDANSKEFNPRQFTRKIDPREVNDNIEKRPPNR